MTIDNQKLQSCLTCNFTPKLEDTSILQKHHLIPCSLTGSRKFTDYNTILVCPTCHRIAHQLMSREEFGLMSGIWNSIKDKSYPYQEKVYLKLKNLTIKKIKEYLKEARKEKRQEVKREELIDDLQIDGFFTSLKD